MSGSFGGDSRIAGTRRAIVILVFAIVAMAASLAILFQVDRTASHDATYATLALEASEVGEDIATLGDDITRGLPPNTVQLEGLRENFLQTVEALRNGDSFTGLPPVPPELQVNVAALATEFQPMDDAVDRVLANRTAYVLIQQEAQNIAGALPEVTAALDTATEILARRRAPPAQIGLLGDLRVSLETLDDQAEQVASRGFDAVALGEALATETVTIGRQLRGLVTGDDLPFNPTRSSESDSALTIAIEAFDLVPVAVETIVTQSESLGVVQNAASDISRLRNNIKFTAENNLLQGVLDYQQARLLRPIHGYLLGGLALLLLIIFVVLLVTSSNRRARRLEEADAQQQEAILRLLDEISTLADGDLTVDVTVTEDFTGAIADSINYTVDTLRTLVGTINQTARQVAESSDTSAAVATKMSTDSQAQSEQIQAVSGAVNSMSRAMQGVSQRAFEMSEEARNSVDLAHSGSDTVRQAVTGMTSLREQIQETSKRIKRLGESSQEIGNIVEFINDIADQTNTLALNASIQASMAGDAGKGFAVVAEEVQRLAERAGGATRQIETLVKTIQADTSEAIVSMERSTTNVVSNAELSERAGGALDKIESSSQQLAGLIGDISTDARAQTESATNIAGNMSAIEAIAKQTQTSAGTTAVAVRRLNVLSVKLRESVDGFTLPEDAADAAPLGDLGDISVDDDVDMSLETTAGAITPSDQSAENRHT